MLEVKILFAGLFPSNLTGAAMLADTSLLHNDGRHNLL